jgi:predicted Rossmann-fold nucleotide-binding protein
MHSVPEEFIATRESTEQVVQSVVAGVSALAKLENQSTQGYNIRLPREQKPSPSIEDGGEIVHFAFRKFALWENVRGCVVLPGGFGTLDELLEVLVLRRAGKTRDPVVLAGCAFWQPIIDTWKEQARSRGGDLLAGLLDDVCITDDPAEGLDFIEGKGAHRSIDRSEVRAFDADPDVLYKRMVREIKLGRHVIAEQQRALVVLGGDALAGDDRALAVASEVTARVDREGVPVRVGHEGQVSRLVEGSLAGERTLQRVLWTDEGASVGDAKTGRRRGNRPDPNDVRFSERVVHKEVLLRHASAYLVLPDAARGKDELCSVLCQIQTGKLPRRPIVLIDRAYWEPIVSSWKSAMVVDGRHAYIEPSDIDLLTFADSTDEALTGLQPALASAVRPESGHG